MGKVLLREYYELCEGNVCEALLTEAEKKFVASGGMMLSGMMQMAEVQNGNGRVYPQAILEREVKNYAKLVKERRALGELDHPEDSVINLKNVSHQITQIWMENNKVMGKMKVLDTPSGNILRSLVESGVSIGISSRGLGSVTENAGKTIVEDDFQLICFDMVSEPSTPGAYMLNENKTVKRTDLNKFFNQSDRIDRMFNDILRW